MSLHERPKAVTIKGNPFTLVGHELKVGDKAPDFKVHAADFKAVSLADFKGKTKIFVPLFSVETSVCDAEIRRFNQEAAAMGEVMIAVVSMDLPFSAKRYCGAAGIDKVQVLSDYFDHSFTTGYGTFIKEKRLSSRAIFVVDAHDKVTYVEYVPEVGQQPNFDAVLNHLKAVKA
jgi:thiol peroxidase